MYFKDIKELKFICKDEAAFYCVNLYNKKDLEISFNNINEIQKMIDILESLKFTYRVKHNKKYYYSPH